MNNILDLIIEAEEKQGISLFIEKDTLKFKVKNGEEPAPEFIEMLKNRKSEIFNFLLTNKQDSISSIYVNPIKRTELIDQIPLSFSQERLWFIDRLHESAEYHIPIVFKVGKGISIKLLEESFNIIVNRHQILRSVYSDKEGEGFQKILPEGTWRLNFQDLSKNTPEQKEYYMHEFIQSPFDLSKDHMLRVSLQKQTENIYKLVIVLHHIACDGWSLPILIKEFSEIYRALSKNEEYNLNELPIQYADYAIWQRQNFTDTVLKDKLSYWQQNLSNYNILEIPTDYPRPGIRSSKGNTLNFSLDKNTLEGISKLSQKEETTVFTTILTILKVLLYRYSGQTDIIVGTPSANRTKKEVENTIGFFVNTLPLRTHIKEKAKFIQLLNQVKNTCIQAFDNQEVPFEKIIEAVEIKRDTSRNPLFQVLFVLQNNEYVNCELLTSNGIDFIEESYNNKTAKFDLTFILRETKNGLSLSVNYCEALFQKSSIERMVSHFRTLISSVINNPHCQVEELNILEEKEKKKLIDDFGTSKVDYPRCKTVINLFQEQANINPDKIALIYKDRHISYAELKEHSNQIAGYLYHQGINYKEPIGICLERSVESIMSILGILKVGGIIVPIDPNYPTERISYIIEETGISKIISSEKTKKIIPSNPSLDVLLLDNLSTFSYPEVNTNVDPTDIAYIIYTSGSTGKPKGVMIEHKALLDHIFGFINLGPIQECKSYAYFAPLSADAGYSIIFAALLTSNTLHILPDDLISNSGELSSYFDENSIDAIKIVPSLWNHFLEDGIILKPKKVIIFGGEVLNTGVLNNLRFDFEGTIYNHYGPTETTIGKLIHEVEKNRHYVTVPIGKPFSNTKIFVVDKKNRICPIGVPGELLIAGEGLAQGYWKNSHETLVSFIPNLFPENEYLKLYKTGDRVKWLESGELEFLGRIDQQIKIDGHRVEIGEIEHALEESSFVSQAAVIAKKQSDNKIELIAFIKPFELFDRERILAFIENKLPHYMIPRYIYEIDRFPLMSNGKINKQALPEINVSTKKSSEFIAPSGKIEEALAGIWIELLKIDHVSVNDNFFEVGGHSLLATRVLSEIEKKLSISLPLNTIFQYPTISMLAEYISLTSVNYDEPIDEYNEELEI